MGVWSSEINTVWEDLRVPVYATKRGGARDPEFATILNNGAGSQGVMAFLFDTAIEEELYFAVQIPHKWKQATDLDAHAHWMPVSDGLAGSKVCWGLEYSFSEIGNIFPSTTIIYGDTPILNQTITTKGHYKTNMGSIDMSSVKSLSPMILCRVFRDATGVGGTDDYGDDAALLEIDFHYQIDSNGSRTEYKK